MLEQFEIEFPLETLPVRNARLRREVDATGVGVRFVALTHQPSTVDPVWRQRIIQNSSLPSQSDPLAPSLAGIQNVNPTPSGTPLA